MKNLKHLFLFALALLAFAGCKDDDTKVDPTPAKTQAQFYFSAKIDGKDYLVQALVDGYGSGAGGGGGNSSGTWQERQSMNLINPTTQRGAGVMVLKSSADELTDCSEIEPLYHTGTYPFGIESRGSGSPIKDGVVIYYADDNGTEWSTDRGTGDQTGSTFEIVEHIANNDGFSKRISKAKFTCKLYDDQGNTKTLTNGEIRSRSVLCF